MNTERKRVLSLVMAVIMVCSLFTNVGFMPSVRADEGAVGIADWEFTAAADLSASANSSQELSESESTDTEQSSAPEVPSGPAVTVNPVFDPITDDMIEAGVSTIKEALNASGETITVIGQVAYKYGSVRNNASSLSTVLLQDVIDDEIVGLQIYDTKNIDSYHIGDVVTVTGKISSYGQVIQLSNSDAGNIKVVREGVQPFEAQELTIAELLANPENYISEYIVIKNAVLGAYSSSDTSVTDATGTLNIYKSAPYDGVAEGDTADVYAAFSKYNTTYQLRNGVSEDFVKASSSEEGDYTVETSVVLPLAVWTGNQDLGTSLFAESEDGAVESTITAYKDGIQVQPMMSSTGGTGTNYYMGCTGLSAGNYYQIETSSLKYGSLNLAFSMRSSATAAKKFTIAYSTDGTAFYTAETITITTASAYEDFSVTLPKGAENAEKLWIRLIAGDTAMNGNANSSTGSSNRFQSVTLTASPIVSDSVCSIVSVTPDAGVVFAGQELTMESQTNDVVIYYSFDGENFFVYDAAAKPVLTELPAAVTVYAAAEGKEDSVKVTYAYTQEQVLPVTASPNGGAVVLGTEVRLTCKTEGAQILYSADKGVTWNTYSESEKVKLTALPAELQVKAVKEGCKESAVTALSYTERLNAKYNIYFGQLHSHTSYSDGAGSAEDAFVHATEVQNLDFLAVTDHSNSFDNANSASLADGSVSEEWKEGHLLADQYTTSDFVSIMGFEMTWSNGLGHMNTFNTEGFQSRTQTAYSTYSTALQNYYATLKTEPDSINQFNHPGTTFGDFSDFAYYDEEIDDLITLIEVGNGEGTIGSSGYFPSYEYYQRALDKGWHVAPTNNQDNHKGLWGDANTARSVILADSLTRENIYDAMRNYRVYATEDNDLRIYYTLDGYEMGSILSEGQTGETVKAVVELSDATDASIGKVQVITNGGLVLAEKNVASNSETVEFELKNEYSFYYVKVIEADGDIAVTAPVWVGEVEAAGINSVSTEEVLPVQGEALTVDLELYNNETSEMVINSIEFTVNDEVVHTANLAEAGLTSVASMSTTSYSFSYIYDKVGSMELNVIVNAALDGVEKVYKGVLKLTYVTPEMVTKVLIDGTHYNDYVTGYYGGNVGNFTAIAGEKNIKVEVVTDEITPEMLEDCALLVISAPARKTGTANAGSFTPSHFSDEFLAMIKDYTDKGGTLIACGIADYQDSTSGQTSTEMNKLLLTIGATTRINSDEAYDEENNGGQPYRLYLKNTYHADSRYLKGASEEQEYSAYSGCTVRLDEAAVAAGKAEALVRGYDTTYSIDCKDENGSSVSGSPVYVEKGNVVALAHETLDSGANIFIAGTVFISDFEVKAEMDNIWDLPYLNRTIAENILEEVQVSLPISSIKTARNGNLGEVYSVEGYVTAGTSVGANTFFDTIYIQDETAGVTIFPFAEAGLELGTKMRITGYVDEYQGDRELQVMSYEILDEKKVIEPTEVSAADAMNYEEFGGMLLKTEGFVCDIVYNGEIVSQFSLRDAEGNKATVFIDGYINSAETGTNTLNTFVEDGAVVSAVGLLYKHPEGDSDISVPCLRVRNCDEIVLQKAADSDDNPDDSVEDSDDDSSDTEELSYRGKYTLGSGEQRRAEAAADIVFGTPAAIATVEKTDAGICITSVSGEVIFSKKNGSLAVNEWQKVDTDWYYFDADRKAAEGWKLLGGKWYYLDDTSKKMARGWKKTSSGKWYYLDAVNGDMKTGWQLINNRWYYLDAINGDMKTDWQFINNMWYYMDVINGDMKTGWQLIRNKWYYLDAENGNCLIHTITPDGYQVDGNGVWVQ